LPRHAAPAGLVLLSDTRTSAGIGTVGTYRKRRTFALDPQRTIAIQFWERRLRESFAELPSFDLEGPST
jgi:predicted proteasome-type protease